MCLPRDEVSEQSKGLFCTTTVNIQGDAHHKESPLSCFKLQFVPWPAEWQEFGTGLKYIVPPLSQEAH